ncbi:MAG: hypothetical protein SFZ23_14780 [Planctomycetota bacterium]|nr:hypothetical protein [Planctomycetota bacterium]
MSGRVSKVVGVGLGLAGFAIASISGIAVQNSAEDTLLRAVLAMFACHLLGLAIGAASEHVLREHLDAHEKKQAAMAGASAPTPSTPTNIGG